MSENEKKFCPFQHGDYAFCDKEKCKLWMKGDCIFVKIVQILEKGGE